MLRRLIDRYLVADRLQLGRIEAKLDRLLTQEMNEMKTLNDLVALVTKTIDVEQSAVLFIRGIAAQLQDALAFSNPALIQDLANQLQDSADKLAAAIVTTPGTAAIPTTPTAPAPVATTPAPIVPPLNVVPVTPPPAAPVATDPTPAPPAAPVATDPTPAPATDAAATS